MCELVFSLQELLKIVPGIAIFPLSFYLAWKKIGTNVSCSINYGISKVSANQFKDVILTNNKDKPIAIFEIQAVMDNDISFSVDKFDPPIILKAMETIVISAKPYSVLHIGEHAWEPEPLFLGKLDIYLLTPEGLVKCRNVSSPGTNKRYKLGHFKHAVKLTKKFNEVVYSSEKATFAITYKSGFSVKTAIIDKSGFICGDWDYRYNIVPPELMQSIDGIKEFLKLSKADLVFQIYGIDTLE